MKVLLAVDCSDVYVPAASLVRRLAFAQVTTTAIHVVEIGHGVPPLPAANTYWHAVEGMEATAQECLDSAVARLRADGLEVEGEVVRGHTSQKLIEIADATGTDLVAAGSTRKGAWGSFFFGSVTRALGINSHQSFLVGKGPVAQDGAMHAVFATDHSEYANACLKKFLAWKPAGISKITVVSAHSTDLSALYYPFSEVYVDTGEIFSSILRYIEEQSEAVCAMIREQGIDADCIVQHGGTEDVIAAAMQKTGAELLILGARGHNILERATLGSTAMSFVVTSDYSTLVMRK